jgi:hypothetical protein
MSMIGTMVVAGTPMVVAGVVGSVWWAGRKRRHLQLERERFIRSHAFPRHLDAALRERYPMLTRDEIELAERALRSYFLCWMQSGFRPLAMPSKLVDVLWHAFILDTRAYQSFCATAFGRFFHHIPSAMAHESAGLRGAMQRTWYLCCVQENIRGEQAERVPLLFSVDEMTGIPDGIRHDIAQLRRSSPQAAMACGGGGGHAYGDGGDGGGADGGGCGGGCGGS